MLSLSLAACEPSESGFDASIQPAQPNCAPGAICPAPAAPDAGVAPAPGPSTSPVTPGTSPITPVTPGVDAGRPMDAGFSVPDASPMIADAAPPDGAFPGADAQADAGGDAALPVGDSGSPYPPVADVSAMGPYTPMTVTSTGPGGAYTVFRPSALAPNGVLNPIVSWGNGGATWPTLYAQLPHLASHGFVVVAADNPLVSGAEVRAGIDWIVQQNEMSGSPYYRKLDVKRIAGVGYSAGGLATLEVADDPRLSTIVIISGANTTESARTTNMPKLRTPVAYLCTDDAASEDNCAADFAVIKQPSFFGVMKGTGHVDVALGGDAVKLSATGTTAWLRWLVMNDASFKSWFVGADCKLCKDSAWSVQQKGLQ